MAEQKEDFVNYFDLNLMLFQLIPFWPIQIKKFKRFTGLIRFIHFIYSSFNIIFCSIIYVVLDFVDLFSVLNDLSAFSQNFAVTSVHFVCSLKALNFHLKMADILESINQINNVFPPLLEAVCKEKQLEEARDILSKTKKKANMLHTFFILFCIFGMAGIVYIPIRDPAALSDRIPFRSWFPDWMMENYWTAILIFKTYSIFYYGLILIECVMLCSKLLMYLAAHTKILCRAISSLGDGVDEDTYSNTPLIVGYSFSLSKSGKQKHPSVHYSLQPKDTTDAALTRRFEHCIMYHQHILHVSEKTENIFSYIILIQFVASICSCCFSGFQISVRKFDSSSIALFIVFGFMLFEIFVYCWFANELTVISDKLCMSALHSDWLKYNTSLRRSLLIFMRKTRHPIYLTAGKFFYLSLNTFTLVISKSFSIIVLLRKFIVGDKTMGYRV